MKNYFFYRLNVYGLNCGIPIENCKNKEGLHGQKLEDTTPQKLNIAHQDGPL